MPNPKPADLRPYFDARWYGGSRLCIRWRPWAYYRRRGWRKGHSPGPLFDAAWYLNCHPDVRAAGLDPLTHYVMHGWREGRSPHPAFDAAGYIAAHADVAAAGLEPLAHYLAVGWREGRAPHPLFDVGWYLDRNPDVALAGLEPLSHFLGSGWRERREPSPDFSLAAYVAARPVPLAADVNPFVHFLVTEYEPAGADARTRAAALAAYAPGARAVAGSATPPVMAGPANRGHVRAIAMYLPQFHRMPENDAWWGEGFTEWTNVRRARPMFADHQQPHVPHPDVGYYDLADPAVLERQAEMARRHGIHGFCFYHYWFDGRRILEQPVERLLASGQPDFPFCLCWANENWTRTWDGLNREVLLEQRHSADGDERFLRDLLPALRDPRYITVAGRPLLAVYRPGLLADPAASADRWRRIAEQEGLPGLHLAAVHSFDQADPRSFGFDAAIQFPPLQIPAANLRDTGLSRMDRRFCGGVLDYREALCHSLARPAVDYLFYRGVMPGWDNTARRMERATAWVNSSPELYGRWLRGAVEQMQREQPPEQQLVFINAWNEWAEGAHLEPDVRHGYRVLEETAAALLPQAAGRPAGPESAACVPARHGAVLEHRRARLHMLFGSELPERTHGFLLEQVAAVAGLGAAGLRLFLDAGRPACDVGPNIITLDDSSAIAAAVLAARPQAADPFAFVVLQFNQPEVTARCVASLRRLSAGLCRVHVVVVDNGSEPATVSRTRELFAGMPDVTLLFTGENLGFARGNNVGYAHVRDVLGAGFIAVINNDTVVGDPEFVGKCLASFAERAWSVLGPDIVTPDGRHENPWNDEVYEAGEWAALGELYERQRAAWEAGGPAEFRRLGRRSPQATTLHEPILQGAAYVFSPVFTAERPQAFDERTFLYGEEFLLAVDCLLAGHHVVYDPRIVIAHEEGVSTARVPERTKLALGYDAVIETAALCQMRLERHQAALGGKWLEADAREIPALAADGRTHVLVDLLFCQPGFHGGGEYGKAVFKAIVAAAASRGDVQLWAALDPALFIDGWVWQCCREHAVNIVAVKSFAEITGLVNSGLFSSFFAPAIVVYTGYEYQKRVGGGLAFTSGPTRVIGTLHDIRDQMLAEAWPQVFELRRASGCRAERALGPAEVEQEATRQAAIAGQLRTMYEDLCSSPTIDRLVTVSAYSAASVRARVGCRRRLEVLFSPPKDRPTPEPFAVPGVEAGRDEFALLVNAGRIEKNAAAAVAAFDRLCSDPGFAAEYPRLKLVLVGIGRVDDLGLEPLADPARFVTLPHLSPERLEHLYREARFLLYPSFNEGFGYPPLEAMAHGTPSIISANTAVPEVCGAAAIPCDPFDTESIAAAIRTILAAPPAAEELRRQFASVAARQAADLAELVEIVCGRPGQARDVGRRAAARAA